MSRTPTSTRGVAGWLAMTVAVGVCAGVGVHLLDATGGSGSRGPSPRLHGQAVWRAGAQPAPAISLRDQDGRRTTLDSLRGNTVALTFLDTRCRRLCAREARALGIAMRRLPRRARPALVVVSVDPRDTPAAARAAARRFGLDAAPAWHWLLGSRSRLAPVWRSYRIAVHRGRRGVVYTPATYLIGAGGFERAGLLFPFPPTWPAGDLSVLAGRGS